MRVEPNTGKSGAIIIEGHIQGLSLTRSLGEKGIPVYVVDKGNCIARYSRYSRKFFKCPDYKDDAFADYLLSLAKNENLNGWILLPSNDNAVITLSRNKQRLSHYYKMLVPEYEMIEQIYNKGTLIAIALSLGVPVPITHCFTKVTMDNFSLSFPVLTRGKHGLAFYGALRKKAFTALDKAELMEQLETIQQKYILDDTFTQSVIPYDGSNKTISFTAFSVAGEIKTFWLGVKLREHPVQFGTATFAESVVVPELWEPAQKIIKHFQYTGVCEIEFLKDPSDNLYKLIEINARTWLWVGLARTCGIDYGLYIYNYLNGIENSYPGEYKSGLKWINLITDTVYSIIAVKKGLLTIKQYIKSMKGKKVKALYYKGDNKPLFAYAFMIFSFLKRR
jgi:D-aspartate ligase